MEQAEEYLDRISTWTRKKNSLEDARRSLNCLGNPDRDRSTIHVAGIDGRDSVYAFLTSILEETKYSTNTFISPHPVKVREHFLINGRMADQESFEEAFKIVFEASRKLADQGLYYLTFFELLFYMTMVLFRIHDVGMVILETDIDGRLDITNVLERPTACVVTSTSMDHIKYLGNALAKITEEKTGIIKTSVLLIFGDRQPEVSTILEGFTFHKGATKYSVGRGDFYAGEIGGRGLSINARMKDGRCLGLETPLETFYQAKDAMLAVHTLDALRHPGECPRTGCRISDHSPCICPDGVERGVSDQHTVKSLKNTLWPGRMEQIRPGVYPNGARSPGGIKAFIQTVGEISNRRGEKPWLLFAAVLDRDYERMAERLCKEMIWETAGATHMNGDRGLAAGALAGVFRTYMSRPVYSYGDTKNAVQDMVEKSRERLLFCTGSLYLIGGIRAVLRQKTWAVLVRQE